MSELYRFCEIIMYHYGNNEGSNRGTECHNDFSSDNTSDSITDNAAPCAWNGENQSFTCANNIILENTFQLE